MMEECFNTSHLQSTLCESCPQSGPASPNWLAFWAQDLSPILRELCRFRGCADLHQQEGFRHTSSPSCSHAQGWDCVESEGGLPFIHRSNQVNLVSNHEEIPIKAASLPAKLDLLGKARKKRSYRRGGYRYTVSTILSMAPRLTM